MYWKTIILYFLIEIFSQSLGNFLSEPYEKGSMTEPVKLLFYMAYKSEKQA